MSKNALAPFPTISQLFLLFKYPCLQFKHFKVELDAARSSESGSNTGIAAVVAILAAVVRSKSNWIYVTTLLTIT